MSRREGGWSVDLHVPDDARIEYRFEIRRGDRVESTLDPSNPDVAGNPFGQNSVLHGSRYPVSPPAGSPIPWSLTEFRVAGSTLGGRRHHHLLSPVGLPARERLPLVVLHDGTDYRRHARLEAVLGSAIAAGTLPFLRVALLDPRHRNTEYAAHPAHAAHVAEEIIPYLSHRIGIGSQRVVGGASLGAVAAWHTVASHPGLFSGLVLQSGTFAFSRHPEIPPAMSEPIRAFLDRTTAAPATTTQVAVGQTCGRFESLIDWNRQVAEWWSSRGGPHRYVERWTGHDWGAWSDLLVETLAAALAH